jgi:uncharacterized membrane protein
MSADQGPHLDNKISRKEGGKENNWKLEFPSPLDLKSYNDIFENGAYHAFMEFQKISDHIIEMEKLAIPKKLKLKLYGQLYGFIVAICFLVASFILIFSGHGIYGTILGSVNLIGLVTIFVLNKSFKDSLPIRKKNYLP